MATNQVVLPVYMWATMVAMGRWPWGAPVISSCYCVLVLGDSRGTIWRKNVHLGLGELVTVCQLSLSLWLRPTSGVSRKSEVPLAKKQNKTKGTTQRHVRDESDRVRFSQVFQFKCEHTASVFMLIDTEAAFFSEIQQKSKPAFAYLYFNFN